MDELDRLNTQTDLIIFNNNREISLISVLTFSIVAMGLIIQSKLGCMEKSQIPLTDIGNSSELYIILKVIKIN